VGANGGLWFYIPPMVSFFLLLSDLVGEKEQRLRLGLQLMGARGSAYWLSWFIWAVAMNTAANAVLILSGFAFQISFFTNSSIVVLFFLFGSFGVSCVCMAMGCRCPPLHFHSHCQSPSKLPPPSPPRVQCDDQQPTHGSNRWVRRRPHWIRVPVCAANRIRVRWGMFGVFGVFECSDAAAAR
jgi:hypothetical protein